MSKIIILAFLPDGIATEQHKEFARQAREHGVTIQFRNAKHVADDHKPEHCHGVTDFDLECLPAIYADHPTAESVVRENLQEIDRRRALVGDSAPTPPAGDDDPGEGKTQGEADKPATAPKKAAGWKQNQ